MNTLVIYDKEGFIIDIRSGVPSPREPIGVSFIWVDIPNNKRVKITDGIGVDVSVTPHRVILEDIPKTETELLKDELQETKLALAELAEALLGGE